MHWDIWFLGMRRTVEHESKGRSLSLWQAVVTELERSVEGEVGTPSHLL
jgi:hypothetical protein